MELDGKVAIVTGSAVRLGRAIALALAERGCGVAIHYHTSEDEARETARELEASGAPVALVPADLNDPAAPAGLVDDAMTALGRLDVLVNSASLYLEGGLADTDTDDWDRQFAVNLRAPFLLCQAFARALPEDSPGRIINLNDARLQRGGHDHLAYRLTKAGLQALTRSLASELAPRITVNELALGAILPPVGTSEETLERVRQRVPLRRSGSPTEVASAVCWLAASDFVTGATLTIDGAEYL